MKRQNFRSFLSGVLVALLGVALVGSAAATIGQRTLTADYSDIKVTLDGKQVDLKDATGAPVEPFTVNGTTYLPVRAVGEALGLSVDWDGETHTVVLTSSDVPSISATQDEPPELSPDAVVRQASGYAFLRSWIDTNQNTVVNGNPAYSETVQHSYGNDQYSLILDKVSNDITVRLRAFSSFDETVCCTFLRLTPDGQTYPTYFTFGVESDGSPLSMGMGNIYAPVTSSDDLFSFNSYAGDAEAQATREELAQDMILDALGFAERIFEEHVYGDYDLSDFGFTIFD